MTGRSGEPEVIHRLIHRGIPPVPLDAASPPGPITAYRGNYVSLPAAMLKPPVEGNRSVPISILWTRDGTSPGNTVEFNAASQRVTPISQIAALYIDNSSNPSNVGVIFPDTNFMVTAPANSLGYYPVISNGLRFYAFNELLPQANDRTIMQVLNFLPPALAIASGPPQGASLAVTEVDTLLPIQGGPITGQGTISLNSNHLLSDVIETYPDVHLTGTFEVNGLSTLAATRAASLVVGTPPGPPAAAGDIVMSGLFTLTHNSAAVFGGGLGSAVTGPGMSLLGQDATPINNVNVGFSGNPNFDCLRAQGTGAAPTPVQNNNVLGRYTAGGYDGNIYSVFTGGLVFTCTEPAGFSPTAHGTQAQIYTNANGATAGQANLILDGGGNLTILGATATKPGSTSWVNPSDPRLKEADPPPYHGGLAQILAIEPVEYTYNGKGPLRGYCGTHVGLDAEQVREHMPELVGVLHHDGESYATIDAGPVIFALVNAVKELETKIRRLERGSIVVGASPRGRR